MRKASLAFLLLVAAAPLAVSAAPASTSLAMALGAAPLSSVPAVDFAALPPAQLEREDLERTALDLPPRFAVARPVHLTPATSGSWERLAGDLWAWRLRIRAHNASSLNLGFTRFHLPPGAQLEIHSANGAFAVRPFTAADNADHGQLWTPVVPTDDLVVELVTPAAVRDRVELELGRVGQGYRGFGSLGVDLKASGSCNMDIACLDPTDPWRDTARAVGVISLGGSTFCSGSLVNDTARDRKMYFVTAGHCGVTTANAPSLVVYWNYQSSTCRQPGTTASGSGGNGTLTQFHTGSQMRAGSTPSDFTMVELSQPANPAFHHFWAGWDRSVGDISCPAGSCYDCSPGTQCAGIHHPNTNEKRITFSAASIAPASWTDGSSPGDGTHLWVHWNPTPVFPPNPALTIPPGVTEPGSSGSPLYDQARRFIGQLHGGPSFCGATGDDLSDYYGRFNVSWGAAGTFLDVAHTGETVIDGMTDLPFADGFEHGIATVWSGATN